MNNALEYVAKNGEIVLSASWTGDKADRPLERNPTQSSLIKKLDGFAGRIAKILHSQTGDPLGCLDRELDSENTPLSSFVHSSDLLDTIGNYFEMKGKNFGATAAPRVADYDDSSSGPVQTTEDRIKSLCYSLIMHEEAISSLQKLNLDAGEQTRFDKSLFYYDQFEHQRTFANKPAALKDLLNQSYTQGQIHQYCPSAYP